MTALLGGIAPGHPGGRILDLSDVQVIVYTDYLGQALQVVEDGHESALRALLAVPMAEDVRGCCSSASAWSTSSSRMARTSGHGRASRVPRSGAGPAPSGDRKPGPDATGVGWVQYRPTSRRAQGPASNLDQDRDHRVSQEASAADEDGPTPVYSRAALARMLAAAAPPTKAASPAAWTEESVDRLHEAFDRDGDGRIDREELDRAANFRGISLDRLRSIQDWYLEPDLTGCRVLEIASVGGFVRQYQVEIGPEARPQRLAADGGDSVGGQP